MKCSFCNEYAVSFTGAKAYCIKHEGIARFGKEGYERINSQINKELWIWTLGVALPISLFVTFIIWSISK